MNQSIVGSALVSALSSIANSVMETPIKASIESSKVLTVEAIDNHVYFYADVNPDRCLDLIRTIRMVDGTLRNEREARSLTVEQSIPIWLHIHSPGGSLFAGLALADQLKAIKTPIYSIIEGYAASAATLISIACTKRYMLPNSFALIHQFSALMWGTYEQFKDEMKLQDMVIETMIDFYYDHTKGKLSKEEIAELLKHDSWFSANQAVGAGLVDEIWIG